MANVNEKMSELAKKIAGVAIKLNNAEGGLDTKEVAEIYADLQEIEGIAAELSVVVKYLAYEDGK